MRILVKLVFITFLTIHQSYGQKNADSIEPAVSFFYEGKFQQCIDYLNQIISKQKTEDSGAALTQRGACYAQLEMIDLALNDYKKAEKIGFINPSLFFNLSNYYIRVDSMNLVKKYADKAIETIYMSQDSKLNSDIYYSKASYHFSQIDYQTASLYYQESLEYDSMNWRSHRYLGEILLIDPNMDTVRSGYHLDKAIEYNPGNDPTSYFLRGQWYAIVGDFESAISDAYKVEETGGTKFDKNYLLTDIYGFYKGDNKKGLKYAIKALEQDPEHITVLNNVAYFKMKLGDYKGAIKHLDKAIKLDPEFPYPYNNKAECLINLGKYSEALDLVNKSLSLDPANSFAFINLAKIYGQTERSDEACKSAKKAKNLNHPETKELNRLFRKYCK